MDDVSYFNYYELKGGSQGIGGKCSSREDAENLWGSIAHFSNMKRIGLIVVRPKPEMTTQEKLEKNGWVFDDRLVYSPYTYPYTTIPDEDYKLINKLHDENRGRYQVMY